MVCPQDVPSYTVESVEVLRCIKLPTGLDYDGHGHLPGSTQTRADFRYDAFSDFSQISNMSGLHSDMCLLRYII